MDSHRRKFIQSSLLSTSALALGSAAPWVMAGRDSTFKIGFVSPQTGPLSAFTAPDAFTLEQVRQHVKGGIKSLGKPFDVEIIVKDSQSNPKVAALAAEDLIASHGVDLVLACSTPLTTIPVSNVCEARGVPCITNDTPWQSWFYGRNGDPRKGFDYTYHFCWGVEDMISTYTNLWNLLPGDGRRVGALWPNDQDGMAWAHPEAGFPPALKQDGFHIVDPGRFETPASDFIPLIQNFQDQAVDIVTGVITPPEFATFWKQSKNRGFEPKIVTVAKATEFHDAIRGIGDRAEGLSIEMMWSPSFPFNSSITGQTGQELAQAYTEYSGQPWDVTLGMKHSLFEVALSVLKRAGSRDPKRILRSLKATSVGTVMGNINFNRSHIPNLAKTPLVGGQWQKTSKGLELLVVENSGAINVPIETELQPIKYG
ncbi:MAG: ABC transporter substrate-binding protein [Oceanobacter sp.]